MSDSGVVLLVVASGRTGDSSPKAAVLTSSAVHHYPQTPLLLHHPSHSQYTRKWIWQPHRSVKEGENQAYPHPQGTVIREKARGAHKECWSLLGFLSSK